jgi:hypothetical protein
MPPFTPLLAYKSLATSGSLFFPHLSSPSSMKPMALDLNKPPPDEDKGEALPDLNEQQHEDEANLF